MTHLHVFMDIDTCPMCGRDIYVEDANPYVELPIRDVPSDAVFEIVCKDETKYTCGKFVVKRKDPVSYDNDWVAEYIPIYRDW